MQMTEICGYITLLAAFLLFSFSMYGMVVSKFMPYTGNVVLDFFKDDYFYCLLFPALLPSTYIFMYLNWLSMKYFRHS